jgi:hypothetical protein
MTVIRVTVSEISIALFKDGTVTTGKHGVEIRSLGKDQIIGLLMKEVLLLQGQVEMLQGELEAALHNDGRPWNSLTEAEKDQILRSAR